MRVVGRFLAGAALALSVPAAAQDAAGAQPEWTQAATERGREASRLLLVGESAQLSARMSPTFLAAVGGAAGVDRLVKAVRDSVGPELEVLEEIALREGIVVHYYRRSRFEKLADVTIYWAFDNAGTVQAGSVRPTQQPAPTTHLDYRTGAELRLPFGPAADGRWFVGWGGRDLIHNYHAISSDQRFAYDLFVMANDGPFRTDGSTSEDYYCFGQPILAPAAGTVVTAIDGLPDNPPGQMDRANAAGNHVVIDHGGEFSFLAHFQQGSVTARPGDEVSAGQPIGRCGNSGNSSMPHLHYHLQTTAIFAQGEGLPAQFNGYRADGRPVERGEPQRGEYLDP